MSNTLREQLKALGFPLFEPGEAQDANATVAEVVKSNDPRLWEGFPVVLANAEERGLVDLKKVEESFKQTKYKEVFEELLALSLALYNDRDLKFTWAHEVKRLVRNKVFEKFLKQLKNNMDVVAGGNTLSSARLKNTFANYFNPARSPLNDVLAVKEEMGVEYALSQFFSPKQKELFLKKLKNEKLTKTEKEYFSRAVKKKVVALANSTVHRLAQKLLE